MDNSGWRTTETDFRGKNIKRIYSALKDLMKATPYLVLQNPLFCFYLTKIKHNSQRAEMQISRQMEAEKQKEGSSVLWSCLPYFSINH